MQDQESTNERAINRINLWKASLDVVDREVLDRLSAGQIIKTIADAVALSEQTVTRKIGNWRKELRLANSSQLESIWLQIRSETHSGSASALGAPTIIQMFQNLPDELGSANSEKREKAAPPASLVATLLSPILLRAAQRMPPHALESDAGTIVKQHSLFLALVPKILSPSASKVVWPTVDAESLARWIEQDELFWVPMLLTLRWCGLLADVSPTDLEIEYESDWGEAFRNRHATTSPTKVAWTDYLFWETYRGNLIRGEYPPCMRDAIYQANLATSPLTGMLAALFLSMATAKRIEQIETFDPHAAPSYCCRQRDDAFKEIGIDPAKFWTFLVMAANGLPSDNYRLRT